MYSQLLIHWLNYLAIKCYSDEASRHQYYLQLRHNVKNRNLVYACVAEELIYLLVGLALQADFGDHVEAEHTENYFSLEEYFPDQVSNFSFRFAILVPAPSGLSFGSSSDRPRRG